MPSPNSDLQSLGLRPQAYEVPALTITNAAVVTLTSALADACDYANVYVTDADAVFTRDSNTAPLTSQGGGFLAPQNTSIWLTRAEALAFQIIARTGTTAYGWVEYYKKNTVQS